MPAVVSQPRRKKRSKAPKRARETYWHGTGAIVAGVDEVGRGAWAGPLVAAAVVLPAEYRLRGVRDSKMLSAANRERIAENIRKRAEAIGIGLVEIGEFNLYGFSWSLEMAGRRALENLGARPDQVLLDGRFDYLQGIYDCETIVGGDATELCIAAASVIAKVHRDALMTKLAGAYPEYRFDLHKGYGTPTHRRALKQHGPCPLHRTQWQPINRLLQQQLPV